MTKEVKKSINNILKTLNHDQAKKTLQPQLETRTWPNQLSSEFTESIDVSKARRLSPKWLELDNFLHEFSKLNSKEVWDDIFFKNAPIPHILEVAKTLNISINDISSEIHKNNQRFYGLAIPLAGLTSIYGKDFNGLITLAGKERIVMNAASAMADHFDTTAENVGEIDKRLKELFPPHDSANSQYSAFRFFWDNNAFENDLGDRCPAIIPTQIFLESFGQIYNEGYDQVFLSRIVRTE